MTITIVLLVIAFYVSIQMPVFQTYMVSRLTSSLNASLGGKVNVGKVYLKYFNTLMLTDVTVVDDSRQSELVSDTLFRADNVLVSFSIRSILAPSGPAVSKVKVKGGEMNLVIEDNEYGNNLSRIFRLQPSGEDVKPKEGKLFELRKVALLDFRFTMKNVTPQADSLNYEGGIDWTDLDVLDINMDVSGMKMISGVMYGKMNRGSFREKSGFNCREISGTVRVGKGLTSINSLTIRDDYSDIFLDNFSMHYQGTEDFSDYINKVRMTARIQKPCLVDLRSIAFFAPVLDFPVPVMLQGAVNGTVADFNTTGLEVSLPEAGTGFHLTGGVKGLPDMSVAVIDAQVIGLGVTVPVIEKVVKDFTGKDVSASLSSFSKSAELTLTTSVRGKLSSIKAEGLIRDDKGYLGYSIGLAGLGVQDNLILEGRLKTESLDVGHLLDTEVIGEVSVASSFKMKLAPQLHESSLFLDTLNVSRLNLNNYDYSGIMARGLLEKGTFFGRILSRDPNLNFMFDGRMTLVPVDGFSEYRFMATIGYANLNALNFDKRWPVSTSLNISSDFVGSAEGELLGHVSISDFILDYDGNTQRLGEIHLESSSEPGHYTISLNSDFIAAEYNGDAPVTRFVEHLEELAVRRPADALVGEPEHPWNGESYDFRVNVGDLTEVLAYLSPEYFVDKGTMLNLNVDRSGAVNLDVVSARLAKGTSYLRTVVLDVSVADSVMAASLKASEANIASLLFGRPSVDLFVRDNKASLSLNYSDGGGLLLGGGTFTADLGVANDIAGGKILDVMFKDSYFSVNDNTWHISPSSMRVSPSGIVADSVIIGSGYQRLVVDSPEDRMLNLSLENFDIGPLNVFMPGYDLAGRLSGDISVIDMFGDAGLLMDLKADSARVADTDLGSMTIMSKWDSGNERFNIFVKNSLSGVSTLNMTGYYKPDGKYINANVALNSFSTSYFRPLLSSFLSDISGTVSGDLSLSGTVDKPELMTDNLMASDVMMQVDFTKVPYWINGPIRIDNGGVHFDNLDFRDRLGNKGRVTGGIYYNYFKDIRFSTRLAFTRMECINISEKQADLFYGKAYGTGVLEIKGPLTSLELSADVSTYDKTDFHLPLASTADAGGTSILTFKAPVVEGEEDAYDLWINRKNVDARTANLLINLRVTVNPSAAFHVEIDKSSGNVLSGRGAGVLDIGIQPTKSIFEIRGDYTLESGNYKFVALNIASRDFTIDSGSKIQFRGDVLESNLDIKAIYSTKTSIGTLIADTSSVSTRRVVNCGLGISGRLLNPTLNFSIDIPDLDPIVRSRVESALSTQDKVQKQFVSLLVSNSFLPDEQSSIVNNSSMLLSNVTEIMSGQLNSLLQKLDIPLDLGLNYQQTDKGTDIFDVAVSTQLFNNRVIVNGNIGNKQKTSTTTSDVVGDVDIEIKLDKPGALRLKLFSHSADQYTSYLDQTQRNGIGVSYQQEFSTLKELWRKLFWGRKRKQAAEEELIRRMLEEDKVENVVIEIEAE